MNATEPDYKIIDPAAHLLNPDLVCTGPWSLSYSTKNGDWWQAGIRVGKDNPGNCFMHVGLGGPGAINSSKEAVEATAAYVVSLPNRVKELEEELLALRATAPRPAAGATGVVGEAGMARLHGQLALLATYSYVPLQSIPAEFLGAFRKYLADYAAEEYKALTLSQASPVRYWRDFLATSEAAALTTPPAAPEAGAAWVSVQDRLPETKKNDHPVFTMYNSDVVLVVEDGKTASRLGYCNDKGEWFSVGGGGYTVSGITHWMPLPAAPAPTCTGCARPEPCGSQQKRQEQEGGGNDGI